MAALACRDYYVHTQDVVRARRVSGEDRFAARRCRRCLSHRPKDATSTRRHVLVELASPAATGEPPFAVRAAPSTRATRSTPDRSRGRTTSARRWPSCRSRPSTSWNGGAPAPSRLVDCISVLSVRHPPQASLAALAGRLARDARLYLAPEDGRALAAPGAASRGGDVKQGRHASGASRTLFCMYLMLLSRLQAPRASSRAVLDMPPTPPPAKEKCHTRRLVALHPAIK